MGSNKNVMKDLVDTIVEEAQSRGGEGLKAARATVEEAVGDADLSEKMGRVLEFVDQAGSVLGTLAKKAADEAAEEGAAAAKAIGDAAEAGMEGVGDALDSIDSEFIRPARRYGRGIFHGLLIGAALALLYTPVSGQELRRKVGSFVSETRELVDALRGTGGPEPGA